MNAGHVMKEEKSQEHQLCPHVEHGRYGDLGVVTLTRAPTEAELDSRTLATDVYYLLPKSLRDRICLKDIGSEEKDLSDFLGSHSSIIFLHAILDGSKSTIDIHDLGVFLKRNISLQNQVQQIQVLCELLLSIKNKIRLPGKILFVNIDVPAHDIDGGLNGRPYMKSLSKVIEKLLEPGRKKLM